MAQKPLYAILEENRKMTKKRYLSNKTLDVINDNVLDIMYFVKEEMNDECNQILRLGDEIRSAMINSNLSVSHKMVIACLRINKMKDVLDDWKGAPKKVVKIVSDIINQLC